MNETTREITPQAFWEAYRDAFRETCNWKSYRAKILRTAAAKEAARQVITETFHLKATREWFRIDYIGEKCCAADPKHNWFLQIAFDHENDSNWRYEIGSHVHIASTLSVIAAYWNYRRKSRKDLEDELQASVSRLKEQMTRVPNREWLFIFGPEPLMVQEPFVAYTIELDDPRMPIRRLSDAIPLNPQGWADFH